MSRKTSATLLRLNLTKNWSSEWFADTNYSQLLGEDLFTQKYLSAVFKKMQIILYSCNIKRTSSDLKIELCLYNLGKETQKINFQDFKNTIMKISDLPNYQRNLKLTIKYNTNIFTNANLLASFLAHQLENHIPLNKVIFNLNKELDQLRKVKPVDDSNIVKNIQTLKGLKIKFAGRFEGIEMARTELVK